MEIEPNQDNKHQTVKRETFETEYLGHDATYYQNLARWGRSRQIVGLRAMQDADLKLISNIGNRLAQGQPLPNKLKRRKDRVITIIQEAKKIGFSEDTVIVTKSVKPSNSGATKEVYSVKQKTSSAEKKLIVAKDEEHDESSRSHYDYRKIFERSILSPFPEEWTPALPYLRKAHRLEMEGADQHQVDEMIEKARQEDSIATSYYLGRWAIIKKSKPKYVKINLGEQS